MKSPSNFRIPVLLLALALSTGLQGQQKHALIIGISQYEDTNWNPINASNDTLILKEALLKRGFEEENIHCYSDESKLTRDRIKSLIELHLVKEVAKGDVAYFHFSGHGQQIPDQNGDELDGLDEALVPYDAPGENQFLQNGAIVNYEYDKHLRDDELGELLRASREKLGTEGSLLVTIDACHSGTATRSMPGPARGTPEPNVPEGWSPPSNTSEAPQASEVSAFGLGISTGQLAPMTCIFASGSEQLNMEYGPVDGENYYGSLSYAVSSVLAKNKKQISCKSLFAEVKSEMNKMVPSQNPQAEGALEIIAFGGKLQDLPEFSEIAKLEDGHMLRIRAGRLSGIQEGAVIGFYPADTWDTTGLKPDFLGQVTESGVASSRVRIEKNIQIDRENLHEWWAFPITKGFGSLGLKIGIYSREGLDMDRLTNTLSEKAYLTLTDGLADVIIEYGQLAGSNSEMVTMTSSRGELIFQENMPTKLNLFFTQKIEKVLEKYARYRWLQRMSTEQPGINAQLRLTELDGDRKPVSEPLNMRDTIAELQVGKRYQLDVKNMSFVPAYYTVYYLPPRVDAGSLENIDAFNKGTPAERKLKPLEKRRIYDISKVEPPPIYEHFLLVVSTEPIHWDPVEQTRGQGDEGDTNNLQEWYADRFASENENTDDEIKLISDNISIYPIKFRIVE